MDEAHSTSKRLKLSVNTKNNHPDSKDPKWIAKRIKEWGYLFFMQFGPHCNATQSEAFNDARCNVKLTSDKFFIRFASIFRKGIQILRCLDLPRRTLNGDEEKAVQILNKFLNEKEKHERSLRKVLVGGGGEKKTPNKTDVVVVLAEHLLGQLTSEKSYTIDSHMKKKGKCKCGFDHCADEPQFGSTGMGNTDVWHGFLDIVFSCDPVGAAVVTDEEEDDEESNKSEKTEEEEDEKESPGGKSCSEVKLPLSGSESQAIAQAIVFSYIQRKRHPSFDNFMIPNILISPHYFRIIMYDSLNDILLISGRHHIFESNTNSLSKVSIALLWMVLNYKIFSSGIQFDRLNIKDLKIIQSNFRERAGLKFPLYEKASKVGISSFPSVPIEDEIPENEFAMDGNDVEDSEEEVDKDDDVDVEHLLKDSVKKKRA